MSVGDENGPVGSDDDGGRTIEGILARAGDSGLAQRQQNLTLWAEFENLLALAVFALAVSSPHVSVLVHRETVRKDKHSGAKAVHEPAGRIELENGRQLRAGARVSATSVKSPDIASTVNRDANDGAELPSLGKLRPVLHQVIGIGLRASGASGNRDDRDECDQQNDSHSICIWLHSPSFCQKLERDSSARPRKLLQLVLHFGDARLGAGFLHGLATWRPAQADGADCLFTDHDRNAAAERNNVRKTALAGDIAFGGAFRPVGGGPPERQRGVGLAAGGAEVVRRRSVALEKYSQPAGAIENRDRYAGRALVQSGFRDDQGHLDRNVFLRKHLCFYRRRCRNECRQNSHEAQSNRHRILPFHCPMSIHGQLRPRRMADYVTPRPI